MKGKPQSRAFRPWQENEERLEFAGKAGLNVSEVINEVLQQHLREHLQRKTKQIRESLAQPVP